MADPRDRIFAHISAFFALHRGRVRGPTLFACLSEAAICAGVGGCDFAGDRRRGTIRFRSQNDPRDAANRPANAVVRARRAGSLQSRAGVRTDGEWRWPGPGFAFDQWFDDQWQTGGRRSLDDVEGWKIERRNYQ